MLYVQAPLHNIALMSQGEAKLDTTVNLHLFC